MLDLFTPLKIGKIELKNRIIMAPLTRCRSGKEQIANDLNAEYYSQRAAAGLIISEGSQISPMGVGYHNTPGIHSQEQIKGWQKVTNSVHKLGGKIFCQLWHVGRVSHPYFVNGQTPIAPSAILAEKQIKTPIGLLDQVIPKAMDESEIKEVIEQFKQGAINAIEAGFDGVELHGANGYIIDQFLCDSSNHRTDKYGGNIKNRMSFLSEILEETVSAVGSDRVGIRLSPSGLINGAFDSNVVDTFSYVIEKLNDYNLAYLHCLEPFHPIPDGELPQYLRHPSEYYRQIYKGILIANCGYTKDKASTAVSENKADAVSFGKLFISNPDLVYRFKNNLPLSQWNRKTYYTDGPIGYTDYPNYHG